MIHLILSIILAIIIFNIFHSMFGVIYNGVGGFFTELIVIFVISMLIIGKIF